MRVGSRKPGSVARVLLVAAALQGSALAGEQYARIAEEIQTPQGNVPPVYLPEGQPFLEQTRSAHASMSWRGSKVFLQAGSQAARELEVSIYHAAGIGDSSRTHFLIPAVETGDPVFQRSVRAREDVLATWEKRLDSFRASPRGYLNDWLRRNRGRNRRRGSYLSYGYDWNRLGTPEVERSGVKHVVTPGHSTPWFVSTRGDPLNSKGYGSDLDGFRTHAWVAMKPIYRLAFETEVELPAPGPYVVVARADGKESRATFLYTGLASVSRRDGDRVHLQVVEREDGSPAGKCEVRAHWVERSKGPFASKHPTVHTADLTTDSKGALEFDVDPRADAAWYLVRRGKHLLPLSSGGFQNAAARRAEVRGASSRKSRRAGLVSGFAPGIGRMPGPPPGGIENQVLVHLTTDRQVYKPGETIQFRGVARRLAAGVDLAVVGEEDVKVQLGWPWMRRGGQGAAGVVSLKTDELGTFHGSLKLEKDQRTGDFPLRAEVAGGQGQVQLTILAYRKPEHEVTVEPAVAWTLQGETARLRVHGRFTVGGNLADAAVRWNIRSQGSSRTPAGQPGGFTWRMGSGGGVNTSGKAELDPQGRFEIPVDLTRQPHDYDVVANVTVVSPDGREVHGETRFFAPTSRVAVGLASTMSLVEEGEPWVVRARTVRREDPGAEGATATGLARDVELVMIRKRWVKTGNSWKEVQDTLRSWKATTGNDGTAEWRIDIPKAGNIELTAMTRDDDGNLSTTKIGTYRFGPDAGWWRWDRLELSADRPEYRPGETAKVLVRCPLATGSLWWSMEGAGLRARGETPIVGYSALLEVPITAADRPVAKLHVEAVKEGRILSRDLDLKVPAEEKMVDLELRTDARVYQPGGDVEVTFVTSTQGGAPFRGDVCLAVVDAALAQVAPDRTPDPYVTFYGSRRNLVGGLGGGHYGGPRVMAKGMAMRRSAAPMAEASFAMAGEAEGLADQAMPAAAPMAPGGGGGGGTSNIRVRSEFRDVAHWVASVRTDAKGRATVRFRLPDDLARWRLVAYAVDAETRVGKGESHVIARKDLMVRLGVPRFLTSGDHLILKASVQNVTPEDRRGSLTFSVDGARPVPLGSMDLELLNVREASAGGWLVSDQGPVKRAPDRYDLTVPGHGHDAVDFPLYAWGYPDSGFLTLKSMFDSAGEGDALLKKIPVVPFGRRVTETSILKVENSEVLAVEKRPGTYQNATHVTLDLMQGLGQAVQTALVDDLRMLIGYRYGCTEQTLSRFVPLAIAHANLGADWLRGAGVDTDLEPILEKGIERLKKLRNGNGWGWGPGEEASSSITAYVISRIYKLEDPYRARLVKALDIPRAVSWLERLFEKNADAALDREERDHQPYRMLAIYRAFEALSLAGRKVDPPRLPGIEVLRGDPRFWAIYGGANLARGDLTRARRAADELAKLSHGNTAFHHWKHEGRRWSWYADDTETTALVLEFLLELAAAGYASDAFEPGLRWMTFGDGATWYRSTKARAVAASVAAGYLGDQAPRAGAAPSSVAVKAQKTQRAVVPASPRATRPRIHVEAPELHAAGGRVTVTRERGPEIMARVDTTRYEKGPFRPEANGFTVNSRLVTRGDPHPTHEDLARVVEFTVPEAHRYALLEVPLLAGGEVPTKGDKRPKLSRQNDRGRWYDTWQEVDVLDDRVVFYFSYLSPGTYRATVTMTPELAGYANMLPARLFLMYFPEVNGTSESHRVRLGR